MKSFPDFNMSQYYKLYASNARVCFALLNLQQIMSIVKSVLTIIAIIYEYLQIFIFPIPELNCPLYWNYQFLVFVFCVCFCFVFGK